MSERGWWYRATTEERLAQIDGAIELGMTAPQAALNCGCLYDQRYSGNRLGSGSLLRSFAASHGRSFSGSKFANREANGMTVRNGRSMSIKRARLEASREAYFEGQEVDFWNPTS